ncbi:MAG: hypothetical protein GY909_09390 [Oligoflexia bacterium]|nr:hypothetical protein [Oligoflexia bacterium]
MFINEKILLGLVTYIFICAFYVLYLDRKHNLMDNREYSEKLKLNMPYPFFVKYFKYNKEIRKRKLSILNAYIGILIIGCMTIYQRFLTN